MADEYVHLMISLTCFSSPIIVHASAAAHDCLDTSWSMTCRPHVDAHRFSGDKKS